MTDVDWQEFAGKRVRVRAPRGSFGAELAPDVVTEADRSVAALERLLSPRARDRGHDRDPPRGGADRVRGRGRPCGRARRAGRADHLAADPGPRAPLVRGRESERDRRGHRGLRRGADRGGPEPEGDRDVGAGPLDGGRRPLGPGRAGGGRRGSRRVRGSGFRGRRGGRAGRPSARWRGSVRRGRRDPGGIRRAPRRGRAAHGVDGVRRPPDRRAWPRFASDLPRRVRPDAARRRGDRRVPAAASPRSRSRGSPRSAREARARSGRSCST